MIRKLTIKKRGGKVNTHVGVPLWVGSGIDSLGDLVSLDFLDFRENALARAKAHDNLRHTQQERLYPKFHELPVEGVHVSLATNFLTCLEFDPIDGAALHMWLRVPN